MSKHPVLVQRLAFRPVVGQGAGIYETACKD